MNYLSFPLPQNFLHLTGPAGQLETIVSPPAAESAPIIGIICHPHPLHGGTMQNKVVSTLARTFYDLGLWSIRFNFRGIGSSEGQYDEGRGELEDLLAVAAFAQQQFPAHSIWLAGFSFGAYIAMQGAAHLTIATQVKQLITIAPAVNYFASAPPLKIHCPWLLAMGEKDELVPIDTVKDWVKQQSVLIQTIYLPEVGHFFHGQLLELREKLKTALNQALA
jgi:alpha/beta superfamily hydrolase